jgi:hypothetical protein
VTTAAAATMAIRSVSFFIVLFLSKRRKEFEVVLASPVPREDLGVQQRNG